MTLKAFVKNLEDVPEALRPFYKQQSDGRFKFDAEDVEDVAGLKSALEHERNERKTAKEKLAALLDATDGLEPDVLKQLAKEHQKGTKKKAIDEDKVEELIEAEVNKRITKMQELHKEELGNTTKERDALRGRLEVVLIENTLQTEAATAGVLPEALPDVIRRGRERFHLEEDKVIAKDKDGNILYGSDGKNSQSVNEFMAELKGGARHLFAPSKGGGANRQFNSGHGGAGDQGNTEVRGIARMRQARDGQ